MNLQLFGYDDGFYYGQCKLICEVETLDGNGKTVTISDGTNNWSATVQNKIAAFLLPPRNKYTVTLINGVKSEYVKDVALGYGECYHLMLADGYDPIMQRDKLSLQEIAASTGNIDGYVPDAAAVKQLNSNLVANGTNFVFDYKDEKYGYNTDPNRGADTFHPFSGISKKTDAVEINKSAHGKSPTPYDKDAKYMVLMANQAYTHNYEKGYGMLDGSPRGNFYIIPLDGKTGTETFYLFSQYTSGGWANDVVVDYDNHTVIENSHVSYQPPYFVLLY